MVMCGLALNKEHLCRTFATVQFVIRLSNDNFRPNAIPAPLNNFFVTGVTKAERRVLFVCIKHKCGQPLPFTCH